MFAAKTDNQPTPERSALDQPGTTRYRPDLTTVFFVVVIIALLLPAIYAARSEAGAAGTSPGQIARMIEARYGAVPVEPPHVVFAPERLDDPARLANYRINDQIQRCQLRPLPKRDQLALLCEPLVRQR